MNPKRTLPALCLLILLTLAAPAPARGETNSAAAAPAMLFAEKVSWYGFVKYWKNWAYRADRVVLIVAIIGGLAFLIIVFGGKWRR